MSNKHTQLDWVMRTLIMEPEQKSLNAWQIAEDAFKMGANPVRETLFALGNGYLGLRGAHEEEFPGLAGHTLDGTFINGFYESSPIHYPETSYGLAKVHQFMLNVPNSKYINFSIDNENFDLFQGNILHYNRSVDLRTGILHRNVEWTSPSGKRVSVKSQRLVSFTRKNLFAIQYEIKSLNFSGHITLKSAIDGRVRNVEAGDDPRFGAAVSGQALRLLTFEQAEEFLALAHITKNTGLVLVSAIANKIVCKEGTQIVEDRVSTDQRLEQVYSIKVEPGDTICLTKYGAYFTSCEHPEAELMALAKNALMDARSLGFASLCAEQEKFLANFWRYADIQIGGNEAVQQAIHFSQFHLLQSVGRDGRTSIAAKGLTGEGYGGHYFWDAEIYALPFYLYSQPLIARKMLEYRYSILDKARDRAREMSHKNGALYAWRTIAGEECSAYFPAGTAQYHINADIAYAIKLYYEATGDDEFMTKYGTEIVMETARIWMGIGCYVSKKNNQFCINGVTGPDEYTALVDNNLYTNIMAQTHLKFAYELAIKLKSSSPEEYNRIATLMDLSEEEPVQWLKASESMYLPYDKELGIHPQDDTFLSKEKWNLAETPRECHPLLMHYHYLVIYRYQVCKQADVVLALLLLGDRFAMEDKRRDYDYYEAITTHDSSLSLCTFSIVASEVGYRDKAYKYFIETARGDLDNRHGNTSHGVHIAAMAGTWMAVVYGFGGMRAYGGKLQFSPYLPKEWQSYTFRIYFQSKLLLVEIGKKEVKYELLEGDTIQFAHCDHSVQLNKTDPVKVFSIDTKSSSSVKEPSECLSGNA